MTESWTKEKLEQRQTWCAGEVLSGLAVSDGLPDLKNLAERLVAGCGEGTIRRCVAVALPTAGAALLEPSWAGASLNCLFQNAGEVEPQWCVLPESWDLTHKTAGIVKGSGTGPWPPDRALPPGDGELAWQELVFFLAGQPTLVVLMVHPATVETTREVEKDFQQLQRVLNPLLQVWATARKLDSDLCQARTENQALTRLNLLQEKIVAMASHEFKTPLTSITAYTDALRDQVTDAEFPHATEFLGVIRAEAGRLLRMVNRILDFSRAGVGLGLLDLEPEKIEPLVTEIILSLRPVLTAKGLQIETHFAPDLPRARIDSDLVRQVLVNLLSNAIKYTPAEGKISITVTEAEASVRVSVADTGMGIPSEDLQRVFREFYRTEGLARKEEGTGLGLTIVRNIMNLHGGHIDVARRSSGGTDFSCYLPKEVKTGDPLPLEFSGRTDRDQAWRLVTLLLYMTAELTGNRTVELQLRNGRGGLAKVASLGPELDFSDTDKWLTAELNQGKDSLGILKVGSPMLDLDNTQAAVAQLGIIADMVALALLYLTPESPMAGGASSNSQVTKVIEAVRSILHIRRWGIPTSTIRAIDLVDKLGNQLGVGAENVRQLQYAALFHDAGMARVEVEIVLGESELSMDQRDEVDRHVEQGVDLVAPLLLDPDLVTIIRHHHERFDGQGYPDGLHGREIPLGSRLLAVIDAWFALTRERTFRPGLQPEIALRELKNHTGTQFDADVVQAFEFVLKSEGIIPASPAGTKN